jgi:succinate-semialdehyde dehydrogenase / glutarate-semialdehyde dehydrogenase
MPIASINPATGETLETFEAHTAQEVERRLTTAAVAYLEWRKRPVAERAQVVRRAGDILDREKNEFGRTMTLEMGKTLKSAVEEAAKCALGCRYYAENAERFLAPEIVAEEKGSRGYVRFDPIGVILAVMPWNFPFWQVIRFAAPALTAGNVGLLKHASNVPRCALALEDIFRRAGAPEGVFQTLLIPASEVGGVLADRRVAAATLTGSEGAGREVGAAAGKLIKKTVLELGGSDPFIVMPSANITKAAEVAVTARTINNGQSCIAAKRFIVADSIADEFERHFVERFKALRVGDPMAADTDIGPLATPSIAQDLEEQVAESVAAGARLVIGGERITGPGNYFQPTILANAPPGSPAYRDELFGPVASLFRARTIEDAIHLANDTMFGLGAAAWTNDRNEAERFARELEAGTVAINGMVASDPRFPFGGVKHSGYGRELSSYGQREFVNIKTVRMNDVPAGGGSQLTE